MNLKLKGMRLMHANEQFIKKHFENVGGEPKGNHPYSPYNPWVVYLTSRPVVARILEGDEAAMPVELMK
ncbi:hypothetical protein MKW92_015249 [Papaver armeniacum]|nr:hypothetical protein MKW92_015249 [Papaver armeniacum]